MKLMIERFGGIIPGTDPVNLPQNAAQTAQDVDLSQGTIRPWGVTNAFRSLNNGSVMNSEVSAEEFTQPSKPTAPAITYGDLISDSDLGSIFGNIKAKVWKFDRTDDTGTGSLTPVTLTKDGITRTVTGFILHCSFPDPYGWLLSMINGDRYEVVGPLYQVNINSNDTTGNPSSGYAFPTSFASGGPILPAFTIPIYSDSNHKHPSHRQVGNLQLVDVSGPQSSGVYQFPGDSGNTYLQIGGNVDLHFECNWRRNTPISFYYLCQNVGTGATAGRDGPESNVSQVAVIEPGKYASVTNPGDRLYRSANTSSGFGLIDSTGATFKDDLTDAITDDLPPNGTVLDLDTVGSIVHPAGYAVYYMGATLYPSSEWIDAPRYWAVPLEYAYTFDSTIQCIALAAGTILVFTSTSVYRVHGQHPGRLTVYKVSDLPISSKLTLWRDETIVGWCNEEGLVQFDGNSGRLLTGPYMRANTWQTLFDPSEVTAMVNDKAVILDSPDSNVRFDFRGDRTAAISTFTVTNGTATAIWKSKSFILPKPMAWYACRIEASTYPVTMKLYGDGALLATVSVAGDDEQLLPRMAKCWRWEIQIETTNEVRAVALATNRREL
jgi:hypothetical protein